jgi:hypothetical protein
LIWFLVPWGDFVGGGRISICHFHAGTELLLGDLGVAVVASTLPNTLETLKKYTRFPNTMEIFSFDEIITYFKCVEHVILQIPEHLSKDFVSCLSASQRLYLDTVPRLHINIMLQNIDQCQPGDIASLRTLTDEITCTTAHDRYSTQEQSTRFGIPLHKLSVFVDHYQQHPWAEKQDIIVLSPDQHPLRGRVIDTIAKGLPHLELITVQDMSYENYRSLIAKAKWSLTFGEGLDAYFGEMALTGGVPFAVYNDRFFMPEFRGLPTVYDTWPELQISIVKDILNLDHDEQYHAAGEPVRKVLNGLYDSERYRENIRLFYEERYSFPGDSPPSLRRDDEMLARARRAVAQINQRELALAQAIEARDANIAQLEQAIEARDANIAQLGQAIEVRDANIAQLGQAIEARDANIAQAIKARDANIERAMRSIEARDANIAQLGQAIKARDANIAQLGEAIEARDADIAQLRECSAARDARIQAFQAELSALRQSTSWKVTGPLRSTVQLVRSGITGVKNMRKRAGGKL